MPNIPKNLSDADMFTGHKETISFENDIQAEKQPYPDSSHKNKAGQKKLETSFLTPELQQAIGKALLDLKLKLYKEGIVDYDLKVKLDGYQVVLTAKPKKVHYEKK